ncbi:MAG TPA: hypothetical protein ENK96_02290 [Desulfobulbaceae bacterium]|nr:hypothetical protein [Desulfobulbaceae bacterium]
MVTCRKKIGWLWGVLFFLVLVPLVQSGWAAEQNAKITPIISQLLFHGVKKIKVDAVIGESLLLGDLIFPDQVATWEQTIDEKWDEIDALYEFLATVTLPPGYTNMNVCDNLSSIIGSVDPVTYGVLDSKCTELASRLEEFSNLQEVVNYAADYLWESNNESVADVNGNGIALVTNEGIATITVTDPGGRVTHEIIINAQKIVHKVRQLQIQNEAFVSIEDGKIQSYNADGSVKASVAVTVDSYDSGTGDVVLSDQGALLVSAGQLIIFGPCTVFPDGMIRSVTAINDNSGTVTLTTQEGSLTDVVASVDLEHEESVDAKHSEPPSSNNNPQTTSATVKLAPDVKMLSRKEFREAVTNSPDGQIYLKSLESGSEATENNMLLKAALSGDWSPDFAFTFDKSHGSLNIKGTIGFKMPIHVYMRISNWKLKRFNASFKPTQYSDITISSIGSTVGMEQPLAEVRGPSIKFMIGPLPVWVRPIFEISVGGSAEGSVTLKVVDYEVWNKYGVKYTRGRSGADWRPFAHYNRKFKPPELSNADYSLSAWGQVRPNLRFYGLGGPYARARIGARLTADTSITGQNENWAKLRSYIYVSSGVAFDITVSAGPFDHTIVDYQKDFGKILELHRTEWDSNGPYSGL